MKSKGFVPIEVLIVALVLAILGGGVWIWRDPRLHIPLSSLILTTTPGITQIAVPTQPQPATPTPDPPVEWKTYIDDKYNYSFKSPPDWSLSGIHEPTIKSPDYDDTGPDNVDDFTGAQVSIFVNASVKSSAAAEFRYRTIDVYRPPYPGGGTGNNPYLELSEPVDSILDDKKAIRAEGRTYYFGDFIQITVLHKGQTFIITLDYTNEPREKFEPIFNQILSTFKFLD